MEIVLTPHALEDRDYWKRTGNTRIMKRITDLLEDIKLHPFTGIGKPEPLKDNLRGLWAAASTTSTGLCTPSATARFTSM